MRPILRLLAAAALLSAGPFTAAQDAVEVKAAPVVEGAKPASGPKPPEAKPEPGEAKPDGEKKPDAKPGEAKPDAAKPAEPPAIVTRPAQPEKPADPQELDVRADDAGTYQFDFHGQPWKGVLEWLARVSNQSLDWQELPGDYLNLRTQRPHTVDEIRDLLNQHLMARGFTILRHGEVLSVVKLDKLDPALVPKVEPAELDARDPHEFVQTTFPLDWLPAATAEEELKPLLGPKGKLTKLTATNRLHAIDAVTNLIAVRDLLGEEQSGRGRERLVRSFTLKHAKAATVKTLLEEFLGIEKKTGPAMPMDPRQMQQMQQQMQQMAQQNGGAAGPGGKKKEPEISIIANPRENAVIAQAPPETMAVIEQTVELLDVPSDAGGSLLRNMNRMQVYRLASLDPEPLVKLLVEMGDLDPMTKITADKKNKSVLVNGPLVDHMTVRAVLEKLDGSDRSFEVIRLRRLPADYVAGTVRFMMGGEGEEKKKKDNSYRRYFYYDPYGSQDEEKDDPSRKFRIDADVANNRLLLWANEIELEEVRKLLVKLGEIRPADAAPRTVRVLELTGTRADEFLERLRGAWTAKETHPLVIEPKQAKPPEESGDPFVPGGKTSGVPRAAKPQAAVERVEHPEAAMLAVSDEGVPDGAPSRRLDATTPDDPFARPRPPTPVRIGRGPDGRLVITSDDPRALDAVEDLMYELVPPPKDYEIFKLKHPTTWAYGLVLNLEDFFGTDEKKEGNDYMAGWFGYPPSSGGGEESPARLSARKKLKFISDEDSGTILVQGATPEQLDTIRELIEIYDRPQSQASGDLRVTKLFRIRNAKAETVATAIKDVYRDLLSESDRALQNPNANGNNQQQQPSSERSYTYVFGGSDGKDTPQAPIKFKGLLSIGIDPQSNTLVVSSSQGLMNDVAELIDSLDQAAGDKPAVSVVPNGGVAIRSDGSPAGINADTADRLREIFGEKLRIIGPADRTPRTSER